MQKKAVCILLAMVMLFSGFSAFAASENNPIFSPIENTDTAEIKSQARLDLEKQTGEIFKESDSVELIIGLKTEYFNEFGRGFEAEELRDSSNMETQIEFAKRATESALDQIRDAKIDFELFDVLDVILVGFTGRASYGDALKIAELPFIESVGVSVEYREPDFSEMDSRMPNSSKIVGQDRVKGEYDGSGMVVAILDSGVDSQHKAFYLTEKGRTNKKITVSNQDELDQLKNSLSIQDGKYYSEKIPFAYNYYDRNDVIKDTNADTGMHGQHVAGTAAGNTVQLSNGESFTGIAPEAQLLIMRVFGERIATTNSGVYVKAMNEAVKLGADSLNMSLGSPAGQLSSVDGGTIKAIETASKIGCIVAIAAGNEGQFGEGVGNPMAPYPDYGVVGSPGVAPWGLTVASSENRFVAQAVVEIFENGTSIGKIPYGMSEQPKSFDETKDFALADAGKALSAEAVPNDVNGKIALIERGGETFVNKTKNVAAKGAVGAIIYNGAGQGNNVIGMKLDDSLTIPAISIRRSDALELLDHLNRTVKVGKDIQFLPNDNAGKVSDFSSWGMTADGDFKPDIMAPGGNIYSTLNDDQFGNMSGTSMATPHVAGGIALVRSRVNKEFPTLEGSEKFTLVRNLLMSSATPHVNPVTNVFTSPRNQGSGVMNLEGAIKTKVVLFDENTKETKLPLKNVGDQFSVKFVAKNLGNEDLTYNYELHLTTDDVSNGKMTLNPKDLGTFPGGTVTVAANGTETIEMQVDTTQFKDDLLQDMPNGYFLEGFVVLKSTSGEPDISIPFVGFRGEFENLTAVEPFINELAKSGKKPFYFDASLAEKNTNFTHLSSKVDSERIILGQALDYDENHYEFATPAISPNGDGKVDNFNFTATILRNINSIEGNVYELDDQGNKVGSAHSMFRGYGTTKHHYGSNPNKPKSKEYMIYSSSINRLKDGKYVFEVAAKPVATNSKTTIQSLEFYVDRVKPNVKNGSFENGELKFDVEDLSGLMLERASYKKDGQKITIEKKNESYKIPQGVELKDVLVELMDFAYNERILSAQEILEGVVAGKIEFEVEVTPSSAKKPNYTVQVVTNDAEERPADPNEIRPGEYKVFIKGYEGSQNQYVLENEQPIIVKVTKDNMNPKVVLKFKVVSVKYVSFRVNDANYDGDYELYAINKETNKEYKVEKSWFWHSVYLPIGTYRFEARKLSAGYFALFDPEELVITENSNNRVTVDFGKTQEMKVTVITKPGTIQQVYMVYDSAAKTIKRLELQEWKKGGKYLIYPRDAVENYYLKEDIQALDWDDDEKEKTITFEYFSNEGSGKLKVNDNAATFGIHPEYLALTFHAWINREDDKGFTDFENLKPGNYYIKAKDGVSKQFELDNEFENVFIEDGKTSEVTMIWKRVGGSIIIESKDTEDANVSGVEYEVRDDKGELQKDWTALKYGTYTVKVKSYDKQTYELKSDETQTVEISETTPEPVVKFVFEKRTVPGNEAHIQVEFMLYGTGGNLPDGYEVYTMNDQNQRIDAERKDVGKYLFKFPADATEKTYVIQTNCTVAGYAVGETYHKESVKAGETKIVKILVGPSAPLRITSIFSDGSTHNVEYKAVRSLSDDDGGAIFTDMENLYKNAEYEVSPVEVPAGYTVSPTMQETEKTSVGFEPMTFTYTKTTVPTGTLTLKAIDEVDEEVPGVVFEVKKDGSIINDWSNPEYGTYEVSVKSYDMTQYLLLDTQPKQVVISATEPNGKATFIFRKIVNPIGRKVIKSATEPAIIEVALGTDIHTIALPNTVEVTLITTTTPPTEEKGNLNVSWDLDNTDYNAGQAGTYTVNGVLVFDQTKIANPLGIEAIQKITVKSGTTPPVKGSLKMRVVDGTTLDEITDANAVYEVKKGADVITDYQNMELGVYEVTLKSYDESKYEVIGDQSEVVTLTEDNPDETVTFKLKAKGTPPVKGSLTMKVVDSVTSSVIADAAPVYEVKKGADVITDFQNMELDDYEVTLKSFDGTKYEAVGSLTKTVSLTAAKPNVVVSFTLKAKGTTPPPTPPTPPTNPTKYVLAEVAPLSAIETKVGTDIQSLNLPLEVTVTIKVVPRNRPLRPGERVTTFDIELPVTWNLAQSNYNSDRAGNYMIYGTVDTVSGNVENPDGLKAEQPVAVKENNVIIVEKDVIRSVSNFSEMKVKYGTPANELTLPETAKVRVEKVKEERPAAQIYGEVTEIELPILWNTQDYDGNTAGVYELAGRLDLSGKEIENPDGLEAKIAVVVEERGTIIVEKTIVKEIIQPQGVLEAAYGTKFEELKLPESVSVRVEKVKEERPASAEDEEELIELPVQWNSAGYDGNRSGVQKIYGTLDLSGKEIENPNNLEVVQEVKVAAKIEDPVPLDPSTPDPVPLDPSTPEPPKPTKPSTETTISDEETPLGDAKYNQWKMDWVTEPVDNLPFVDVKEHENEKAIEFVWKNNVFKGVSETMFAPETNLTRGMLVTILYRLVMNPNPGVDFSFSDVPKGAYYEEALRWAVSNDIIKGYEDGTFRPNIAPTRQEFASMLDRFVKLVQRELLPKEDAVAVNIDGTGDWARESVSKMLLTGVMTGIDGQFMPKKTTPRAEVAQIIKNLYDTINRSQGIQGIN